MIRPLTLALAISGGYPGPPPDTPPRPMLVPNTVYLYPARDGGVADVVSTDPATGAKVSVRVPLGSLRVGLNVVRMADGRPCYAWVDQRDAGKLPRPEPTPEPTPEPEPDVNPNPNDPENAP